MFCVGSVEKPGSPDGIDDNNNNNDDVILLEQKKEATTTTSKASAESDDDHEHHRLDAPSISIENDCSIIDQKMNHDHDHDDGNHSSFMAKIW
jgi:hypothetical protein